MRAMVAVFVFLALAFFSPARAEKRVALVVGNSAYTSISFLSNPANDAADISQKLLGLGFDVTLGVGLDYRGMREVVRTFLDKTPDADIALMFYAGHGIQVSGRNYLLPVDSALQSQEDLDFDTIPMDTIISAMERNAKASIIFIDACRNNPFEGLLSKAGKTRNVEITRGLAKIETGLGTLISYSTQPGNVAYDGAGERNSPFASALIRRLGEPGLDIMTTMTHVRRDVIEATSRRQIPWDSSSLIDAIVLTPALAKANAVESASIEAEPAGAAVDDALKSMVRREIGVPYYGEYYAGTMLDGFKDKYKEISGSALFKLEPAGKNTFSVVVYFKDEKSASQFCDKHSGKDVNLYYAC